MGCYAYTDVERGAVAPGTTVRVVLERQEAIRQVDAPGGLRERVEGHNAFVTLPWSGVTRAEVKAFSPVRTAAMVGGAGVVAVAVLSVLEGSSEAGPGEGTGPNEAVRIPLLRVRW